jgi:hypothetical protein
MFASACDIKPERAGALHFMPYNDIREAKPFRDHCVRCEGQANVLIEGWTPDGRAETSQWTCPRCQAANAIVVAGKVVGVAIGTGRVVSGESD